MNPRCGHCNTAVDFWTGARIGIGTKTIYVCSNACFKAIKREHEGMGDPPHCNTCRCVHPVGR